MGKQRRKQQNKKPEYKAGFQGDACNAADGVSVTLAAILGVEHDHGVAHGNGDLLYQKLHLIDGGRARQRRLTVAAQHNIVRHLDGVGEDILEGDHQNQPEQRMIKNPIPGEIGGIHGILPLPVEFMANGHQI